MDKKTTFNVWYFAAALAGILLLQAFIASFTGVKPIAYSEFQHLLRDGLGKLVGRVIDSPLRYLQ